MSLRGMPARVWAEGRPDDGREASRSESTSCSRALSAVAEALVAAQGMLLDQVAKAGEAPRSLAREDSRVWLFIDRARRRHDRPLTYASSSSLMHVCATCLPLI
jgi:hypothetical protein